MRSVLALASAAAILALTAACSDRPEPLGPTNADLPEVTGSLVTFAGSGTTGPINPALSSSKCMDVKGINTAAGTPMQIWDCTSKSNQQFKWLSTGQIQVYGSMCLSGGTGKAGDPVVIQACASGTAQQWSATSSTGIKGINGMCMMVNGGTTNGTRLVLSSCSSATNQQWNVGGSSTPTAPTPPPSSGGSTDFHAIAAGIRPRGFGQGSYTLLAPASGARAWYVATNGNDANGGTSGAPLRTIAKAALQAHAGDVVNIGSGTYSGSVVVRNSGTSSAPIVFQAAQRGGVVLSDGNASFRPYDWSGGVQQTGELYITLRGLTFRNYASNAITSPGPNFAAAVKASRGWKIEDCLLDHAGNTAIEIEGSYVTVIKSTLQYTYFEALSAWASGTASGPSDPNYKPLDGIQIIDVNLNNNYVKNQAPSSGGVADYSSKFLNTRGTVIDNMESYSNNGPGFWFDTQNSNMTVMNSYFHDNKNISGTSGTGRGLNLEANWGPVLIQNNVFSNNARMGLGITASQGITMRNNLIVGSPRCIELTNDVSRISRFPLKSISLKGTVCKGWTDFAGLMTIGGSPAFTTPSQMGIMADSTTYDPPSSSSIYAWWENRSIGAAYSVSDEQHKFGWETHGEKAAVSWP